MKISFQLHVNENLFSYDRTSTRTRFEKEAKGNWEMAYYHIFGFDNNEGRHTTVNHSLIL